MDSLFLIPVAIGLLAVVGLSVAWHYGRSSALLEGWAQRHGYRIVAKEYRTFFRGPFFWTTGKGQTVYYVTVEDQHGQLHNGFVRCGGWFLGLLSDHVEVRWDD